jgi:hypothetical protein
MAMGSFLRVGRVEDKGQVTAWVAHGDRKVEAGARSEPPNGDRGCGRPGVSMHGAGNLACGPGHFHARAGLFLRASPVKPFLIIPRIFQISY